MREQHSFELEERPMRTTINEGQAIDLLRVHFGLNAPVAFDDVKKRYRKESKRLHPDSDSSDASEEAFKALSGAFDGLKHLYQLGSRLFDANPRSDDEVDGEPQTPPTMPRETTDGTPLSDLGLGLGPTTNGKECTECDGVGYQVVREHGYADCSKCKGVGEQPVTFTCRACNGSGRFIQQRSRREVDCRVCQGTGWFKHPRHSRVCEICLGTGRGNPDRLLRIYVMKCWTCKGTGETEVLNPVIPKGRLTFVGMHTEHDTGAYAQPAVASDKRPEGSGTDRLFGVEDPNRMSNLLRELSERGVGGKR